MHITDVLFYSVVISDTAQMQSSAYTAHSVTQCASWGGHCEPSVHNAKMQEYFSVCRRLISCGVVEDKYDTARNKNLVCALRGTT